MATGSFTATGTSEAVAGNGIDISIVDGGSFSGTILIQRNISGVWGTVQSITQADLPFDAVVESGKVRPVRLNCSAFSAGTATYSLD